MMNFAGIKLETFNNYDGRSQTIFHRVGYLRFTLHKRPFYAKLGFRHAYKCKILTLPFMHFEWSIAPARLALQTVLCSKCERPYASDQVSPVPGDPAWDAIPQERREAFAGGWTRDMHLVDGRYEYLSWRWLGPCCETRDSGQYGPDDGYEEEWHDEGGYYVDADDDDWDDWLEGDADDMEVNLHE
jgi:hypothetical protein